MRKFILILSVWGISQANAQDTSTFKILEQNIKFYNYEDLRLTVSAPCKKAEKSELCPNLNFLKTLSLKKIKENAVDKNPGSVICKKLLDGKVYIGIDANNNEASFCKLKDNTYIDSGTLTYYAEKNDGAIQKPRKPNNY